MAVNPDKPVLASIINKALDQITEEEKIQIQNKWMGIEQKADYGEIIRYVLIGLGVVVFLFGLFFYWNYTLKREIKRRKDIEKQLVVAKKTADNANKAKGEFLANMSHEIRTPMNAVMGFNSLLERTELTAKQRDYVTKIEKSAKSLLTIINDILDFSKISSGKLRIEHVEFSLEEVMENLSNIVGLKAYEKDIELVILKDKNVPTGLIGDPLPAGAGAFKPGKQCDQIYGKRPDRYQNRTGEHGQKYGCTQVCRRRYGYRNDKGTNQKAF